MKNNFLVQINIIAQEMIDAVVDGNKQRAEKCYDRACGMIDMLATVFDVDGRLRCEDAHTLLDCTARGLYSKEDFQATLAKIYAKESFIRELVPFRAELAKYLHIIHNALDELAVSNAIEGFDALCTFGVNAFWLSIREKELLHRLIFNEELAKGDMDDCRKKVNEILPLEFYKQDPSIDRSNRRGAQKVGDLVKEVFDRWIAVDTTVGAVERTKKGTEFHGYLTGLKGMRCYSSEVAFFYDKLTSDGDKHHKIVEMLMRWGYDI